MSWSTLCGVCFSLNIDKSTSYLSKKNHTHTHIKSENTLPILQEERKIEVSRVKKKRFKELGIVLLKRNNGH